MKPYKRQDSSKWSKLTFQTKLIFCWKGNKKLEIGKKDIVKEDEEVNGRAATVGGLKR